MIIYVKLRNIYSNNYSPLHLAVKDNYIQVGDNGDKLSEAVYANYANNPSGTFKFKAVNNGSISLYDYVNGTEGYKTVLTGDATGTINLYNDIKNSNVTTETVNVNFSNNLIKEYTMLNLNSSASLSVTSP